MKKMKGLVAMESPSYTIFEDSRTEYRHQNLLQDYDELRRETETMKRKLIIMKQKKKVLSAEVRFLRRRYKQLTTNQSLQSKPRQEMLQSQRYDARPPTISKERNYNIKESAQQPPMISTDMNRKESSYYFLGGKLPKAYQVFDLNQNAKNFNGKDASIQSPVSALDLNQKEIMFSGKEANKRSMAPLFDLNEVSREEDDCQAGLESVNMEEPKRSIQRSACDEQQHNDMKMSVCRSSGSGPSRPGKRKISWQDQVALRV